MFHNRVADLRVWQGHDAFCDAPHLDQAVLPVSVVVHPLTGAQRVITQEKIKAFVDNITKKWKQSRRVSLLREMFTSISQMAIAIPLFSPASNRVALARALLHKAMEWARGVFTYSMEFTNKCS